MRRIMYPMLQGGNAALDAAKQAVYFDGTSDYLARGGSLTGAVDNKTGLFSCWLRATDTDRIFAGRVNVGGGGGERGLQIEGAGSNQARVTWNNVQMSFTGVITTPIFTGVWVHLALAASFAPTSTVQVYVDGVASSFSNTTGPFNRNIGHANAGDWFISNPFSLWQGDIAEVYYTNEYLDLSTNISKFISANKPVDLGANGATPTGTQPLIYFSGEKSPWNSGTNLGSGGAFTMTGAVVDSTNEPIVVGT